MAPEILVVDDDRDLRLALAALLELEGFVVHEAEDGATAVRKALTIVPDLVILDMNMPEVDGPEVLRRLRQHPQTLHIPVVVLSSQLPDCLPRLEGLEIHAAVVKTAPQADLIRTLLTAIHATG